MIVGKSTFLTFGYSHLGSGTDSVVDVTGIVLYVATRGIRNIVVGGLANIKQPRSEVRVHRRRETVAVTSISKQTCYIC